MGGHLGQGTAAKSLVAKHLCLQNQQKNAIGSIEKNYLKEEESTKGVNAASYGMLARFSGSSPFRGDFDFPQVVIVLLPGIRTFPNQFEIQILKPDSQYWVYCSFMVQL